MRSLLDFDNEISACILAIVGDPRIDHDVTFVDRQMRELYMFSCACSTTSTMYWNWYRTVLELHFHY